MRLVFSWANQVGAEFKPLRDQCAQRFGRALRVVPQTLLVLSLFLLGCSSPGMGGTGGTGGGLPGGGTPVVTTDHDSDGVADSLDNCPGVANADQHDLDRDRIGDRCDADFQAQILMLID